MKMKIPSLMLFVVTALLLTACRIVVNTEVKSDGSGKLRTAVVFTAKEKEDFSQKPENQSKTICDGTKQGIPKDATFAEETHDGETFCITERLFRNLNELREFYAGMNQVKVNTLQFEMGRFIMDVELDLTDKENGGGLENEWYLTLPGGIGEQNADRLEGQTLIWVVSPGEKAHLHAESMVELNTTPPEAPTNLLVLILVNIFVLVLIGSFIIFLLLRQNRQK